MKLIVLSGVSGTGKTRYRTTHPDLKDLPHVDIADVYREQPWVTPGWPATMSLWQMAVRRFKTHDTVVVEGYFLKGSESRHVLIQAAKKAGAAIKVITFWAPLDVCEKRIRLQQLEGGCSAEEADIRIKILNRCWRPKDDGADKNGA